MEKNVEKSKVTRISMQPSPVLVMVDKKQPEYVEYFNCLGNITVNDARCTRQMKARTAMAKAAFSKKKSLHQQTGLKYTKETSKVLHLEHSFIWY
jgi:hypothetical protein